MEKNREQTPQASLATVERILSELPHTDQFARLRLHLEGRRETLMRKMEREGSGCTGSNDSARSISEATDVKE